MTLYFRDFRKSRFQLGARIFQLGFPFFQLGSQIFQLGLQIFQLSNRSTPIHSKNAKWAIACEAKRFNLTKKSHPK
jgi:hypothetical protein